jgi:hypothetical protein
MKIKWLKLDNPRIPIVWRYHIPDGAHTICLEARPFASHDGKDEWEVRLDVTRGDMSDGCWAYRCPRTGETPDGIEAQALAYFQGCMTCCLVSYVADLGALQAEIRRLDMSGRTA